MISRLSRVSLRFDSLSVEETHVEQLQISVRRQYDFLYFYVLVPN